MLLCIVTFTAFDLSLLVVKGFIVPNAIEAVDVDIVTVGSTVAVTVTSLFAEFAARTSVLGANTINNDNAKVNNKPVVNLFFIMYLSLFFNLVLELC
ncbi:hypothetical protein D3C81_1801610 [compost metagenome]